MTGLTSNLSEKVCARVAGILYLIIIVAGISGEVFVRSGLIVKGDPGQTAANIIASPFMFRFGFFADSVMLLADIAIAVLFYLLLKPVSNVLSLTAAAFRLTQAAVLGVNLLNYYAVILLLKGPLYSEAFGDTQLHSLAMLYLDMHAHGYDLGLLFFGVSNLVLGYLVVKSSYWPSLFGYGLIAAALVYLAGSYIRFLLPALLPVFEPLYIIPFVAELSFCLWLLVKGAKVPAPAEE